MQQSSRESDRHISSQHCCFRGQIVERSIAREQTLFVQGSRLVSLVAWRGELRGHLLDTNILLNRNMPSPIKSGYAPHQLPNPITKDSAALPAGRKHEHNIDVKVCERVMNDGFAAQLVNGSCPGAW